LNQSKASVALEKKDKEYFKYIYIEL